MQPCFLDVFPSVPVFNIKKAKKKIDPEIICSSRHVKTNHLLVSCSGSSGKQSRDRPKKKKKIPQSESTQNKHSRVESENHHSRFSQSVGAPFIASRPGFKLSDLSLSLFFPREHWLQGKYAKVGRSRYARFGVWSVTGCWLLLLDPWWYRLFVPFLSFSLSLSPARVCSHTVGKPFLLSRIFLPSFAHHHDKCCTREGESSDRSLLSYFTTGLIFLRGRDERSRSTRVAPDLDFVYHSRTIFDFKIAPTQISFSIYVFRVYRYILVSLLNQNQPWTFYRCSSFSKQKLGNFSIFYKVNFFLYNIQVILESYYRELKEI